jgi:ribonuclease R
VDLETSKMDFSLVTADKATSVNIPLPDEVKTPTSKKRTLSVTKTASADDATQERRPRTTRALDKAKKERTSSKKPVARTMGPGKPVAKSPTKPASKNRQKVVKNKGKPRAK